MVSSIRLIAVVVFALWSASSSAQKVFFGNLHSHTSCSDGVETPDDAYRHARHTAHSDFLAITEHNHRWAEQNAGHRRDGVLIAINPNTELNITIWNQDDGEPNAVYRVEVYSDVIGGDPIDNSVEGFTIEGNTANPVTLDGVNYETPNQYVPFKVTRQGQPMSLNNGGDTIGLRNDQDQPIQVVTYGPVQQGQVVTP